MSERFKHRVVLSSLLFGLFFGAGNLIFPVSIGQNSGNKSLLSLIGFIVSAVGLAVLSVIFTAKTSKDTLEESLRPYGFTYARLFTIMLLLTIGPFFALPRLATVPYEVSIKPLFTSSNHTLGLFIYSLIFFSVAGLLALKPTKIKTLIGLIINPLFLGLLVLFFLTFFIKPMGSTLSHSATEIYADNPFLVGFQDGYQTMDVLAALMFGFVIIGANDKEGSSRDLFKDVVYASLLAGLYMTIIYSVLGLMGASSLNHLDVSSNGGFALGKIFMFYFGKVGLVFFGILITFACLKTAIGLIVSASTYFSETFNVKYQFMVFFVSLISLVVSNFGLEMIIQYAVPVLNFIYPLALVHVVLGLFIHRWEQKPILIKSVLYFSIIGSIFEVLKSLDVFKQTQIILFYTKKLPLGFLGLSWINFTLVGFIVGLIASKSTRKSYEY